MIKSFHLVIQLFAILVLISSCSQKKTSNNSKVQNQVRAYLDDYNREFQKVLYTDNLAQWELQTHIVKGDTMAKHRAAIADEALAKFTGSKANIDSAQKFLAIKDQLTPLQARQLQTILFFAGNNPEIASDIVKKRIDAQNAQIEKLYGFAFHINGKEVTPNQIQDILATSTDMNKRLEAWTASKEVGKELKDGLANLRDLRNESVTPLGLQRFLCIYGFRIWNEY